MGEVRVLVSYSHDGEAHRKAVLNLTNRLRQAGIDAWIDQFEEHQPPESWPDWMRRELDKADFVLVVVTEGYLERFNRDSAAGIGSGVRWESALITAGLYHGRREKARFLPVVLRREDVRLIPTPLDLTTPYVIGETGDADLTALLRVLRGSPAVIPAALGAAPSPGPSLGLLGVAPDPVMEEALAEVRAGRVAEAIGKLNAAAPPRWRGETLAHAFLVRCVLRGRHGELVKAIADFRRFAATATDPHLREAYEVAAARLETSASQFKALFAGPGPVVAAQVWLFCLHLREQREAWKRLDDDLRLALAQDWITDKLNNPGLVGPERDDLANALAEEDPRHPLAEHLVAQTVEALRQHYAEWGAESVLRRVGPEYEVVARTSVDGPSRPELMLLMRRVGSEWRIANFRAAYVIPGWPPRHDEIPASLS